MIKLKICHMSFSFTLSDFLTACRLYMASGKDDEYSFLRYLVYYENFLNEEKKQSGKK